MRNFIAAMAALAVTGSGALAGDNAASLSPGKPAGVLEAQHHGRNLLLIGGAAVVAVVAIVVATQSSNDSSCGSACSSASTTS